jgi:hypothetical protein
MAEPKSVAARPFPAPHLRVRAWDDYTAAYEDALSATSTRWAPWYVVPADHKWVTRAVVAGVMTSAIRVLDLRYPEVTEDGRRQLDEARRKLEEEE